MGVPILLLVTLVVVLTLVFKSLRNKSDANAQPSASKEPSTYRSTTHAAAPDGHAPSVVAQPDQRLPAVTPARDATEPEFSTFLPRQFIVLDLETTGLDPYRDEIIEFGAIQVNLDSQTETCFQMLVKPQKQVPREITEITGITQKMVESDGVWLPEALNHFMNFIGDLPLVTFNAEFDMGFLCNAAKRNGLVIKNRYTCALKAARLAWPGLPSYRLVNLAKLWNLPHGDSHRALGDCKRAAVIFAAATSKLNEEISWCAPSVKSYVGRSTASSPAYEQMMHREHMIPKLGNPDGALKGQVVVFTGDLSIARAYATEIAVKAGCDVNAGVTKRTTILVAGRRDVALFKGKERSDKYLKAESLINRGYTIRILTEAEFMHFIKAAKPVESVASGHERSRMNVDGAGFDRVQASSQT